MKKVRTEKIMANVTEYLKKRNIESAGTGGTSTEQQAGVQGLVSPSTPNTFTFSTTSTHHSHVDHQYVRLKTWMMEASEPCRSELSQVLFPLFIHLYLELVAGTGRQAAKKFFIKHYQVFLVNRDYENILSQVLNAASINATGDMTTSPVIQTLKSGKYLVRLSEPTLHYFLRYLKATENPTLLQIFNTYIEVEVDDSGAGSSGAVFRSPDTNPISSSSNGLVNGHILDSLSSSDVATSADGMDCSQDQLQKVRDAMARIRATPPVTPSLCVYTVSNAYNGLSCACVNPDGKLLSCGFEDSVVKLWKLTAPVHNVGFNKTKSAVGPRGGISHTLLACDKSRIEDDKEGGEEDEEEEGGAGGAVSEMRSGRRRNRGGELFALRGHSGSVLDTAFTHDSSHLLSVSEDTTMRLWSVEKGQAVALYRGHNYPVWCVGVAPLTMYVATGSYDCTARVWATDYTYPLRTLAGHTQSVDCVDFHPNGTYMATGSCDRSIRLWQMTDGDVARILLHHKAPINTIAFSPNGKYLASGSEDGTVLVWDLAGGRMLAEMGVPAGVSSGGSFDTSGHLDPLVDLCWSADSNLLVSASSDGAIRTSHLKSSTSSEGGSTWELVELYQLQCTTTTSGGQGGSGTGAGQLLHTSLTCHNYLTAVTALEVER